MAGILLMPSFNHSFGTNASGNLINPKSSTVLHNSFAVESPRGTHVSSFTVGLSNLLTSLATVVFSFKASIKKLSLLALACCRTLDILRILISGIQRFSWRIPIPPILIRACKNAFGVSFGSRSHFRTDFLIATSAEFNDLRLTVP